MVTLKDIADKCSLSVATVSKAINKMPDISPVTMARVQQVAREMGYLPNAAARSMKTGRSMTVGMLFFLGNNESVWTHSYSSLVADSIHRTIEDSGYDLTPVSFKGASIMGGYLNYCRYRNYDGIIVMSGGSDEPALQELADSNFPVVTIDCRMSGKASVTSDNVAGLYRLVHHVHSKGHRRIAFIHGNPSTVTEDRRKGFLTACKDLQIDVPAEYLMEAPYLSREASAAATEALLDLPNRPSCIIYPDDLACLGGIEVIQRRGLSIPEDISIVGYDDHPVASALNPKLTTYRQDCQAIGAQAADMLLEAIANPSSDSPRHLVIPGQLVEGESVGNLN